VVVTVKKNNKIIYGCHKFLKIVNTLHACKNPATNLRHLLLQKGYIIRFHFCSQYKNRSELSQALKCYGKPQSSSGAWQTVNISITFTLIFTHNFLIRFEIATNTTCQYW